MTTSKRHPERLLCATCSQRQATPRCHREAVAALRAGELVALPTETVYGLAADAANGEAVARILQAKGRPRFNPLICHVTDIAMARRYGVLDARAERLAEKFWPGPLSLVVPLAADAPVHPLATAGLADHRAARAARTGARRRLPHSDGRSLRQPPIAQAASARHGPSMSSSSSAIRWRSCSMPDRARWGLNRRSCRSPATAHAAAARRHTGWKTSRRRSAKKIERARAGDAVAAPGMLASHYAPRCRCGSTQPQSNPAKRCSRSDDADSRTAARRLRPLRNLSPSGDLVEAAANLFASSRRARPQRRVRYRSRADPASKVWARRSTTACAAPPQDDRLDKSATRSQASEAIDLSRWNAERVEFRPRERAQLADGRAVAPRLPPASNSSCDDHVQLPHARMTLASSHSTMR